MTSRRHTRKSAATLNDSDQDYQNPNQLNSDSFKDHWPTVTPTEMASTSNPQLRTRPTRNTKASYVEQEEKLDEPEEAYELPPALVYDFIAPRIECLLWVVGAGEDEKFLAKFSGRSYLRTMWLSRLELREKGFEVTSGVLKSMRIRMRKTYQLKLKTEAYFNPSFLQADRVLTSTEIFTAIHHKRANDIKGKWDQSIMLVCQKLLNFVKNGYPYGVLLHEPYGDEPNQNRSNVGQVLNRIYLGLYQHHSKFWSQLGTALNDFLQTYPPQTQDFHRVGQTIRSCACFLYQQWHQLSRQRYLATRQDMIAKGMIPSLQIPSEQILDVNPLPSEAVDYRQFCASNIFLSQKVVDPPKNAEELELLNPGPKDWSWLGGTENMERLEKEDCIKLDLNAEVDKLYLVKWRELSYAEATWQAESGIGPEKIEQFKLWNKIPVREVRERMDMHNKIHKFLLEYYEVMSDRKSSVNLNVQKMEAKLYLLGTSKAPREYGGKDVPIYKNRRMLKDFQLESLNWLIRNWHQGRNSILADEMGLGKTIQTIAFLFHLHAHESVLGPFLVLAPLTTLQQWRREIEEWTSFNCLLYYDEGAVQARQSIQDYEFYHLHTTKGGDIIPSRIPKFQVLLTNYQLFVQDFEVLKRIPFQHIVLDEAHRLKNRSSKTTVTLTKLPCCRKTLLTGTPIQNNTRQLWTLLNFIEPRQFANQEEFLQAYGSLSTEEQVRQLKRVLKPYILRRVKEDVESTIPRLSETIVDVEMSGTQKAYYRGILEKNKAAMLKSLNAANFNSLATQLRKCCDHPYLVSPETEAEIRGNATGQEEVRRFVKASGKMILLMKLLEKFKKEGKKVLVFSQFVVMLDLMQPYLERSGYNTELLKGALSASQRHQAITRFNQDRTDVFLISTKAGGVGINLVAATEIIIYDSDWNPQNDIQATARAHRIGQKREVTVYRLITASSYESEMFQLSSKKLGLDKAVFAGDTFKTAGQFDQAEKQMTKADIELLLKRGIIGFLDARGGEEEDIFNQSIEDILSKKARKVEYAVSQNSCAFSKTKFRSQETNDINIDAPDFWEQALKGIETPTDKLVNKRKDLKEYSTQEQQYHLMLETYRIVLAFVKQKTLGAGFNAEDQRNLLRFLEAINSQRHFSRQYREIADQLSTEIIKPSRRFKVKEEDLLPESQQTNQNPASNNTTQQVKKEPARLRRSSRHDNYGLNLPTGDDEEISDVSEAKEDSPSPEEQQEKLEEQKRNEQFQKLCCKCERPRCTVFCKGVCGQFFHKKCFQAHNKGLDTKYLAAELNEFGTSHQQWKEMKTEELKCTNCQQKNYIFKCAVCLEPGQYIEGQPKKRRNKKKQEKEEMNEDSNVYKCSAAAKCSNFFHLKCLFSQEFQGKFSDHTGKTVKDISNVTKLFRCPSHYCNSCYGIDSKSTKLKSYTCIRCCRCYHDKCQDKEKFIRLGTDHYYICAAHLAENENVQEMIAEIGKFKMNKKDKMQIKRKAREAKLEKKREKENSSFRMDEEMNKESALENSRDTKTKNDDEGLRRSKRNKKGEKTEEKPEQMEEEKKIEVKTERQTKAEPMDEQIPDSKINLDQSTEQKKSKRSKSKSRDEQKPKDKKKEGEKKPDQPQKTEEKNIFASFKYQYADFNIKPVNEFNFSQYSGNWCRFCGTRYAKIFETSPWGENKLCCHHYEQYKKGKLKLDKYKNEPKAPIGKLKENELRFLNEFVKNSGVSPTEAISQLNKELGIQ